MQRERRDLVRPPALRRGAFIVETGSDTRDVREGRKERDSNPRYPCGYASLAGTCLRPLSHLSFKETSRGERVPEKKTRAQGRFSSVKEGR